MKIEEMIAANRADCAGCSACANACRFNCITMAADSEGFSYPKINHAECKKCGRCDNACPVLKNPAVSSVKPSVFAVVNPSEFDRKRSSSGGVFYALAESIIKQGGAVFGVTFNQNWEVVHTCAENLDGVKKMQGSKYVQSRVGDTYRQVEDFLRQGRKVLFTGTPCQIAGLKSFLGGDNDNLLTVDLLCHGVPSPAVWNAYVQAHRRVGGEIHNIFFRNKKLGWRNPTFEIVFKNAPKYSVSLYSDLFGKGFGLDIFLRPSCHACKFRPDGHQQSDITIGDFWGVENYLPRMDDNRGTSLVLVHTQKGADVLNTLKLIFTKAEYNDAARHNMLNKSVPMHPKRAEFFSKFAQGFGILMLLERYSNNFGMRVGVENVLPFYGKKPPLFFGDPAYAEAVKNLFKIADGDFVRFAYSGNNVNLDNALNSLRPYAINIFFTNIYHVVKPVLEERGFKENENFVDGRYLFSLLP